MRDDKVHDEIAVGVPEEAAMPVGIDADVPIPIGGGTDVAIPLGVPADVITPRGLPADVAVHVGIQATVNFLPVGIQAFMNICGYLPIMQYCKPRNIHYPFNSTISPFFAISRN